MEISKVGDNMSDTDGNQKRKTESNPPAPHSRFHGYSIEANNGSSGAHNCRIWEIIWISLGILYIVVTFPLTLFSCFYVVPEYQRIVIFRFGRIRGGTAKGPGLIFIIPNVDLATKVDLRTFSIVIPQQEVLTKDSLTARVNAVVYYRVVDPVVAVTNVDDYSLATLRLAALTLRNNLGTRTLSEILANRDEISSYMEKSLDDATKPWGIKVERVEMKDVALPGNMQRSMAAEAEAYREAKAKLVAAEGEQKASLALRDAANIISQNPQAMQLRYLQTLHSISAEKNSTIVFPLPMELFSGLQRVFNPASASGQSCQVVDPENAV